MGKKGKAGARAFEACIAALCVVIAPQAQAQVQRSFINLGFEQPTLTPGVCYVQVPNTQVPGWQTTHPVGTGTGSCTSPVAGQTGNLIELWANNFSSVPARAGNNFAELNAEQASRLYQNICVTKNEVVRWQLSHRGRGGPLNSGFDVMSFNIDSQTNQVMRASTNTAGNGSVVAGSCGSGNIGSATCNAPTTTNTWADYSGTFTWNGTSANHTFGFEAISSANGSTSYGNFLDNIQVTLTPYVELDSSNNISGSEASGNVSVPLLGVVGNVTSPIAVNIKVDPSSTAVLGTDFTTPNGSNGNFTVTIPVGNYDGGAGSRISTNITLIDNAVIQDNRTIVLKLQPSPSNYTIASTSSCGGTPVDTLTYTILDNDIDLATAKSAGSATPAAGVPFTYTVTYRNNTAKTTVGATTSHDVTAAINDAPPTGVTFQSWTCSASGGATCPAASGSGTISGNAVLPAGSGGVAGGLLTYTITAVATGAPNCGKITNTSTITTPSGFSEGASVASGFVSPAPGGAANNTAIADIDPICPSTLTLNKVTQDRAGGPFNFTLTNTAQGSGTATTAAANSAVQVDGDPTTAGLQPFKISTIGSDVTINESALPSGWRLNTAVCQVGGTTVGSLSGTTYTIPAASVTENTSYTCTFTNVPLKADLSITKTNSSTTVTSGSTTTYTIVASNGGPDAANNTLVKDSPGTGLGSCTAICSGTTGGAACPATPANLLTAGGATIVTFPANSSVTFQVTCNVN